MKITKYIIIAIFVFALTKTYAQENRFFMPSEIKSAYDNGTRSYDGKPGEKYWHNTADYVVKLKIDPKEKTLEGSESVTYYNNSPDVLNNIVIRLYSNAYKKGSTRDRDVNEKDIHDGVEIKNLKINGEEYNIEQLRIVRRSGTNMYIKLKEPLKPGEKLIFETSWKQPIPEITRVRQGAVDSTTFFIAYWYPQFAVYDDLFGWDVINYRFSKEFYNNLGNYDVQITIPEEFAVRATGTLINAKDVLPKDIFNKYETAKKSETTVHVISKEDLDKGFKAENTTWHFTAKEVSDFAIAVSDHYCWDACTLDVDGRPVLISSLYKKDQKGNEDLTMNQKKIMKHFCEDIPGVPYPYEAFTTFINPGFGGGMEYPMFANNASPDVGLTIHEMFHTYFPMYVRTNEKRWSWMDEGWASYNDEMVLWRFFENEDNIAKIFSPVMSYSGTNNDHPLMTSSDFTSGTTYGNNAYGVPAFINTSLHHYLGEELFLKCYRTYIKRWAKKSPTPYDYFYTFENVSGKDLSWIWKPWFFEFGSADLGIESFKNGELIINKIGNKPVPLTLKLIYMNGDTLFHDKKIDVWKTDNKAKIKIKDHVKISKIILNGNIIDADLSNNYYPSMKQLYSEHSVSDKIPGTYFLKEFQTSLVMKSDKGMFYMHLPEFGYKVYVYPVSNEKFNSLDDTMILTILKDKAGVYKNIEIKWGRRTLHADRLD